MTIAEKNKQLSIENKILKDKIKMLEKSFEECEKTEYEYRIDMYEDVKKEWEEEVMPDIIRKIREEEREKIIKELNNDNENLKEKAKVVENIIDMLSDLGYDIY